MKERTKLIIKSARVLHRINQDKIKMNSIIFRLKKNQISNSICRQYIYYLNYLLPLIPKRLNNRQIHSLNKNTFYTLVELKTSIKILIFRFSTFSLISIRDKNFVKNLANDGERWRRDKEEVDKEKECIKILKTAGVLNNVKS